MSDPINLADFEGMTRYAPIADYDAAHRLIGAMREAPNGPYVAFLDIKPLIVEPLIAEVARQRADIERLTRERDGWMGVAQTHHLDATEARARIATLEAQVGSRDTTVAQLTGALDAYEQQVQGLEAQVEEMGRDKVRLDELQYRNDLRVQILKDGKEVVLKPYGTPGFPLRAAIDSATAKGEQG